MPVQLETLQRVLQHTFSNPTIIIKAATHPGALDANLSAAQRVEVSNERLELLGDALLGAVICEWLYELHPQADEGELSRLKGLLVSRRMLATVMDHHQLTAACILGPQHHPNTTPQSVKANLAEALIAAVYLDGGYQAMSTAVRTLYADHIRGSDATTAAEWKNVLQDWALKQHGTLPQYQAERQGGSDHAPIFGRVLNGD